MSLNMKSMEDELNVKNNNINLLEKEIDKLNLQLKECCIEKDNINTINLSLKSQNKEIMDNLNNEVEKNSVLEKK